jgi:hypothetical protein
VGKEKSVRPKEQPLQPAKEFERAIRSLDRHQLWRVFSDFVELSALSMSNAIVKSNAREVRYLDIVKRYTPQEALEFPRMLGCVVEALEEQPVPDFLGSVFQALELANHWKGQFFTPMEISRMMAGLAMDEAHVKTLVQQKGFITMQEPACGSGGMVIALAGELRRMGVEPQQHLFVQAIDVDSTAAYMAFVQLSLLSIPAEVVVGNTLSLEIRETYCTPQYWLGMWANKRRRGYALGSAADPHAVSFNEPAERPQAVGDQRRLW